LSTRDIHFMGRALDLAVALGAGAHPNPRVGAVVVRNGRVVGEGAHERFGGPHAEVNALRQAGSAARGATVYVTLEPCSHFGKTPPCVNALLSAGVQEVVAACGDPNPLVSGRGFKLLKKAGVKVCRGVLRAEAEAINEAYFHSHKTARPLVTLKAGITLDGCLASRTGRSKWITGELARVEAHRFRAASDAVLVGIGTVLTDDPSLTVRLPEYERADGFPLRVVLDAELKSPSKSKVFKGKQQTVVFTSPNASLSRERLLRKAGVWVHRVPSRQGQLLLPGVLQSLLRLGVRTVLVEGGSKIHGSFLEERLADRLALFLAPKLLGAEGLSWFTGPGWDDPNHCPRLTQTAWKVLGDDALVTGRIDSAVPRQRGTQAQRG
jgi:diaminohydroxyphosphoribosylaminopyrimidine deaminase/5-amino-6-(5-phosphoribosylamino)uracil reductase